MELHVLGEDFVVLRGTKRLRQFFPRAIVYHASDPKY